MPASATRQHARPGPGARRGRSSSRADSSAARASPARSAATVRSGKSDGHHPAAERQRRSAPTSPMASPASQLRALRAGEADAPRARTPRRSTPRAWCRRTLRRRRTPQPIESTVNPVRAARQPPATTASPGTGARGKSLRSTPATTAHQTATARIGARLNRVGTVRKRGGDRSESNCYGDQMTTGEERNARSGGPRRVVREKRLRRHAIHPIGALRPLAAVIALVAIAAPAAQAQSDSPARDQYIPSPPSASGKNKKQDNDNGSQSSDSSGLGGRPGARPDHRRQPLGRSTRPTARASKSGDKKDSKKDDGSKKDKNAEEDSAERGRCPRWAPAATTMTTTGP